MQTQPSCIWLCEECDAAILRQTLKPGEKAYCPNCQHIVAKKSRYSLHVPLALAVTGLVLLPPSCLLPLIHMQMLTNVNDHSIVSGISHFMSQGMWIPAILITLCAVISPLIYLSLNTILLSCVTLGIRHNYLIKMLLLLQNIRRWGMLEVYLIGVFTAIIKFSSFAKIYPGIGLLILTGLILCQTAISLIIKPQMLWEQLDNTLSKNDGDDSET